MDKYRVTVIPFMLAFIAGVAAMPTNIYQICAWNHGTEEVEPWRSRASTAVRTVSRAITKWFTSLWTPQLMFMCALVALALVIGHLPGHAQHGPAVFVALLTKQDLLDKKLRLANEAKAILDASAADGREALRKEDETKFEAIHADIEAITRHVNLLIKQEETEKQLTDTAGRRTEPNVPEKAAGDRRDDSMLSRGREDADLAFRAWGMGGKQGVEIPPEMHAAAKRFGIDPNQRSVVIRLPKYKLTATGPYNPAGSRTLRFDDIQTYDHRANEELRAQSLTSASGGYTVNPELIREFERARLWFGPMLQGGDGMPEVVRTATGATLPFPTANDTTNKGVRLAENTVVAAQDVAFSIMNLGAFKYSSKLILVSVELMQDAGINLPEFLGSALGERIGRIVNDETTVGTGTTMPWGIVTRATAFNAPSGTATVFGSTTAIAYANLITFLHTVDVAYRQGARFMMHDLTLAKIKSLTDTQGRPSWAPGFAWGVPDTLFGYPYVINNSMVSTLANGVKSIVFGDLSKYKVREVRDVTILRSDDRYIDFHQSAFLAFARYDGDLLNAGTNPVIAFTHTT